MKKDNNDKLIELTQLTKPLMDELIKYAYKPSYCEIETRIVKNKVIIDLEYNCKNPNEIKPLIKTCEGFGLRLEITSIYHDSAEEDTDGNTNYSFTIYNKQRVYISYLKIHGNLTAIKEKK